MRPFWEAASELSEGKPITLEDKQITLADAYYILADGYNLTPALARSVWHEITRILRADYTEQEDKSPQGYDGWYDAFGTIDHINPIHKALLPLLVDTLQANSDFSEDENWVRVYAIRAIGQIGDDWTEVGPLLEAIAQDKDRRYRKRVGKDVRDEAASVLKLIRSQHDAKRR